MDESIESPASNQLPPGVTEADLHSAVGESGYPLQVSITEMLMASFDVQEEWAFIDRDTHQLRSLDIKATKRLGDFSSDQRVRPVLNLLVECKQSQLPYVFFESKGKFPAFEHPMLQGLRTNMIYLETDTGFGFDVSTLVALGLLRHPFQSAPKQSRTFSKVVRTGKKLELSGTEAYSGLVLPLVKAIDHHGIAEKPVDTAQYFDAHLTIAIGILDAPMVAARSEETSNRLELSPWVRVNRHEYSDGKENSAPDRNFAVDVVHRDYFKTYLERHLLPFAEAFAHRVCRHHEELAAGEAYVPKLSSFLLKQDWEGIESHMTTRPNTDSSNQGSFEESR